MPKAEVTLTLNTLDELDEAAKNMLMPKFIQGSLEERPPLPDNLPINFEEIGNALKPLEEFPKVSLKQLHEAVKNIKLPKK